MSFFRPTLLVALLVFSIITVVGQEPQTLQAATTALTNNDIITMLNAKLSQEIIIVKIRSSACSFDTAPDKLAELKKAGVPDAVILAMVQAPAAPRQAETANPMVEAPKDKTYMVYVNCVDSYREVHETAFYASPTLAKVPCGDALTFLGNDSIYTKVQTQQGVIGYIMEEHVSKAKPEAIVPPIRAATSRTARITCMTLPSIPLFDSPNAGGTSTRIAQPKCGEKISVLDEQAAWDKVQTEDGTIGYIASLFVSKEEAHTPQQTTSSASRIESGSVSPGTLRAIAWRAVPWVTTTYYQQPGRANTDCTGSGSWIGSIYQGSASCTTQYTPAQNIPINWTHFTIYNQVETQDSTMVIACTRNWAFSKCSHLVPNNIFPFTYKNGKISVTGQRTGKSKTQDLDFDIISSQPKANR